MIRRCNDDQRRTAQVLEKGKSRIRLDLASVVGVARRYPSPTSKIASQAQIYVIEHYHKVDEHAQMLT